MATNLRTFLACVVCIASATNSQPDYAALWKRFKEDFPKSYANGEEEKRFQYFQKNVDIIYSENAKGHTHQLEVNEFADMAREEFRDMYLGYRPSLRLRESNAAAFPLNMTGVADSVDWVTKGAVTPVKNQQQCGSCWAFSTTGSVEGAYYVATGKLKSLSEEELVQCDQVDMGCKGGDMDNAFDFIQKNGGLCSEGDYKYTSGSGIRGVCKKSCSAVVTVGGFQDVPAKNEDALKAAVAKGPVSVAIEADHSVFQLYKGGVLENTIGCGTKLDHGVLVVGYGTDKGQDYWKVKNSWGPAWGENGYIRLARGKNMCGISQQASYPTGAKDAPPTPPSPPSPPAPPSPPPTPSTSHYEDPKDGCQSDEISIQIQGVPGAICTPACSLFKKCPTDVPAGVTAQPQCALQNAATNKKYCALICSPGAADDDQCGDNASCKPIQGVGLCTYDDSKSKKRQAASLNMEFMAFDNEPSVVV